MRRCWYSSSSHADAKKNVLSGCVGGQQSATTGQSAPASGRRIAVIGSKDDTGRLGVLAWEARSLLHLRPFRGNVTTQSAPERTTPFKSWLSGLKHRIDNPAGTQVPHWFESSTLRQAPFKSAPRNERSVLSKGACSVFRVAKLVLPPNKSLSSGISSRLPCELPVAASAVSDFRGNEERALKKTYTAPHAQAPSRSFHGSQSAVRSSH